jgi:HEAT repeat protein
MSLHDASSYAGDLYGWKHEIAARLHDFLARKAASPVRERVGAVLRKLESAMSVPALKASLTDLLHHLRREKPADVELDESAVYFEKIRAAGRKETIENYSAYIFTVDCDLKL